MSGTNRDLLFWSRNRCFACKNYRWDLGPTETCNSSPKGAVLLAQNHRWGLERIKSIYSCALHAFMCAQNNRWGLGPIQTCYSGPEVSVLHAKTTGAVFDTQRLVILTLKSLFCMHKITGEGWKQYSLFILVLSKQLCLLQTTDEVWDP